MLQHRCVPSSVKHGRCRKSGLTHCDLRLGRTFGQKAKALVKPTRLYATKDEDDESVENLFKKELARRGMSNESLSSTDIDFATSSAQEPFGRTSTKKSERPKTTKPPKREASEPPSDDQRKRSMSLVNEGLEGLLPRAYALIKFGSAIFLGFLPFILAISLLFGGIYLTMGDSFVHRGSLSMKPPSYVDPQDLLSEPTVDPYVPFR